MFPNHLVNVNQTPSKYISSQQKEAEINASLQDFSFFICSTDALIS